MIKVMVVIYGLVAFVPQGATGEGGDAVARNLTILFADASVLDSDMKHQPTMWMVVHTPTGVELGGAYELPANFKMTLSQGTADTSVGLQARWRFPQITVLNPGTTARKACMDNKYECGKGGADLVLGTTKVTGEWTSRHASVCDDQVPLPVVFNDPATFSFRRSENGPRRDDAPPFHLATALVLEADVTSLEGLVTIEGEDPVTPPQLEGDDCMKWIPNTNPGSRCAVVVLGNPPKIKRKCPTTYCPFHRHFDVFYELVGDVNQKARWLPYVEEHPMCPNLVAKLPDAVIAGEAVRGQLYPPLTPPAVRCPPVFLADPDS